MNATCYASAMRVLVDDFVSLSVIATPFAESLEQAMYPVSPALGGVQPVAVTYPGRVVVGETQGMPMQVINFVGNHIEPLRCKGM